MNKLALTPETSARLESLSLLIVPGPPPPLVPSIDIEKPIGGPALK